MKRRSFLKGASSATLLLSTTPLSWSKRSRAQNGAPKFFLSFAALGAWDMTAFADPHGHANHSAGVYTDADILSVGGTQLTYAPRSVDGGVPTPFMTGPDGDKQDFFQKFGSDLLVVRGLDTQTNSHLVGPRHVFSGNIRVGNPAFGAMVGAAAEQDLQESLPMTFMSTGGFDATQSLLPPARVTNVPAFKDLAQPFHVNPQADSPARFLDAQVEELIYQAQTARQVRLQGGQLMPQTRSAMEAVDRARSAESGFTPLYNVLKDLPELEGTDATNALIPKAQIAIAAMASGQCVAANLTQGGFDTHQNHDTDHRPNMQLLIDAVDYTRRTMEAMGLWDDAVLMMGSDFSRTTYNATNATRGKDHWPITHALFMGKGVPGGTVVGGTDNGVNPGGTDAKGPRALKVKANGGQVEIAADQNDPDAHFIKPPDVMRGLRSIFGLDGTDLDTRYPVGDSEFTNLPIFG